MSKVYLTLKIEVNDLDRLMKASKNIVQQSLEDEVDENTWEPEDEGDAIQEIIYSKVLKDEETYGINVTASSIAIIESDEDEAQYDSDLLGLAEEVEEIEE